MSNLWFSLFDLSLQYNGEEKPFVDGQQFLWAKDFENNFEIISEELKQYLEKNNLESYFNINMMSTPKSWKTLSLKNWNIELFKNQVDFPKTTEILKKYPEILSLSFNLLESKSAILPHCGDTNGIYRCHLGIKIPAGIPDCGFRVLEEHRPWKEGQWLIFIDSYNHEAYNHTENARFIMVVDVLRNEFKSDKNKIISTVRTSLFLQKRAQTFKFLMKMPHWFVYGIAYLLRPFASLAIVIVNKLKVY